MPTISPDFVTLRAIEQLYGRWLDGELASEDLLFQLGDVLQGDQPGASKSPPPETIVVGSSHRSV